MRKKGGALELSINTIIIVVIGITLLSLGLVFIRNTFTKLNELTDDTFGKAQTEVRNIGSESRLTVPSHTTVEQGKTTQFEIVVGNDGSIGAGASQFEVQLSRNPNTDQIFNGKVEARVISTATVTLEQGQVAAYVIQVVATSNAPLTRGRLNPPSYAVTVKANGVTYVGSAFTINVEKGKGVFGGLFG